MHLSVFPSYFFQVVFVPLLMVSDSRFIVLVRSGLYGSGRTRGASSSQCCIEQLTPWLVLEAAQLLLTGTVPP